jgi:hypothetical protein
MPIGMMVYSLTSVSSISSLGSFLCPASNLCDSNTLRSEEEVAVPKVKINTLIMEREMDVVRRAFKDLVYQEQTFGYRPGGMPTTARSRLIKFHSFKPIPC